jgi:hypothetical protein
MDSDAASVEPEEARPVQDFVARNLASSLVMDALQATLDAAHLPVDLLAMPPDWSPEEPSVQGPAALEGVAAFARVLVVRADRPVQLRPVLVGPVGVPEELQALHLPARVLRHCS